ncbi:low molecular weight protein-tyrosine-phosphatase [Ferrimonas balearica]|uniref:low molecular weight protein-tyrosine-phosphatase n=1 Tax=Ferrimonas balearica TaxID=44012 RepID=UPI0028F73465|nr:low molecular weight protein-tyrosine-phosphatase [Ferrimonas balearica]
MSVSDIINARPAPVGSILVVCMGNICRSPTAEAVFRHRASGLGLDLQIDSAGTIAYHAGEGPDPRSRSAGEARGYDFSGIVARQIRKVDLERFDLVLAADQQNLADIQRLATGGVHAHVGLILDSLGQGSREVPDPYYGGARGFEQVLDLIEAAADGWLSALRSQYR